MPNVPAMCVAWCCAEKAGPPVVVQYSASTITRCFVCGPKAQNVATQSRYTRFPPSWYHVRPRALAIVGRLRPPFPAAPLPTTNQRPAPPPSRDHVAAGTCFSKVTPKRGPPFPAWSVDPGNGQTLHAKQKRLLGPLGGETETTAWPVSRDQLGLRCVAVVAVGDDSRLIV